jgi:hypothetical protein
MHAPTDIHLNLVKRILRYIKGMMHYGLHITQSPSSDLVIYSDADWVRCPDTQRSMSGYCAYVGANLVSWSSKRQHTISKSSAETEYRGVANAVAESSWLRQLLTELGHPPHRATVVFCDNVSASYMSSNPVLHQRTKHIEINLHFVHDKVALGEVEVLHVPSAHQYADIFIKSLPSYLFQDFTCNLNLYPSPG